MFLMAEKRGYFRILCAVCGRVISPGKRRSRETIASVCSRCKTMRTVLQQCSHFTHKPRLLRNTSVHRRFTHVIFTSGNYYRSKAATYVGISLTHGCTEILGQRVLSRIAVDVLQCFPADLPLWRQKIDSQVAVCL